MVLIVDFRCWPELSAFFSASVRWLISADRACLVHRTTSPIRHFLMLDGRLKCLCPMNQMHLQAIGIARQYRSTQKHWNFSLPIEINETNKFKNAADSQFLFYSFADSGLPPFGRGDDNGMGDDRIAHILSEASGMMGKSSLSATQSQQSQQNDDSHSNDDSDSLHNQSLSPFSKDLRRMRKYENDDISRDKMARIYQEELTKLMTRDAFPKWVDKNDFL